jgi:histone acetyltransferase (RNA polymerase elongator complex component)
MHPLIIPFFIPHAGCPHTCIFCNQRVITGSVAAMPAPEQIRVTVEEWLTRSPGRQSEVAFFGGSFSLLPPDTQQLLLGAVRSFLDDGRISGIRISTRPDALDDAILLFLKRQGVRTIEVGVQSLDDEVLLRSGRGHFGHDAVDAIARVAAGGFSVGAQLLPGLPGDTQQKSLDSLAGVLRAGAQFVRIYPALVLSDTQLAEMYKAGEYIPPDLGQGVQTSARMLHLCLKAGIPVIRIGLQSEDGLSAAGAVLAGCWHPALGQLVKGQLYYDLIVSLAQKFLGNDELELFCHPDRLSEVQGHEKRNLKLWQQSGLPIMKVYPDTTLDNLQIRLENMQQQIIGSLVTDCLYEENVDA